MSNVECNVVRDLMPLCIDSAASEESQKLVEAHTADCGECAKIYNEMQQEVHVAEAVKDKAAMEHAAKNLRIRQRIRALWAVILGMAALMIALVANAAQVAQFMDDTWFRLRYVGPEEQLRLDAFNAALVIDEHDFVWIEVESSPCGNRPFRPEFTIRYNEMTGQAYLQMKLISSTEEIGRYHIGSEEVLSRDLYGFEIRDFQYSVGPNDSKMLYHLRDDEGNHLKSVEITWIELVCGNNRRVLWHLGESFPAVWKNGVLTKSDAPLPMVKPTVVPWDYYVVKLTPSPYTPTPTATPKLDLPSHKQ